MVETEDLTFYDLEIKYNAHVSCFLFIICSSVFATCMIDAVSSPSSKKYTKYTGHAAGVDFLSQNILFPQLLDPILQTIHMNMYNQLISHNDFRG